MEPKVLLMESSWLLSFLTIAVVRPVQRNWERMVMGLYED